MPTETCPDCQGQGEIINDNTGSKHGCITCSGTGRVRTEPAPNPPAS